MRAFEIEPAATDGVLHAVGRPVPVPGPGEVLVRLGAAALNHRDLLVARNFYNAPPRRLIPLSDGAGTIVAAGPGVPKIRVGMRVAAAFFPDWLTGPITAAARARSFGADLDGMLAEYVVVPDHAAIRVPDHLTDAEAATLPCAGLTAWNALTAVGQIRPGMTVLLLGSGGVSVMALQFAKLAGARVIQTSGSAAKRARLIAMGADHVIDHAADPDWHRSVLELTGGQGADIVVEVGGPGTLVKSAKSARLGGTIACVGFMTEGPGLDPRLVVARALRLVGISVGSCAMFHDMNRAIAVSGMRPVVGHSLPMARAAEAYELLRSGGHFGKIALTIPGAD